MKKKYNLLPSYFLLSTLFLLNLFVTSAKENKYFFYKISDNDSQVYLLGSIHFGKSEWYPLPNQIETAFEKSDYLVTEIDITNIDPMFIAGYITSKDGTTLESKLKPENFQKICKIFESSQLGMDRSIINMFRPWFAAITYQTMKSADNNLLSAENGIDMYFTNKAKTSGKEIKEIETAESQLNLLLEFDNFADEIIESADKESEDYQMEKLITAWEKGDDRIIDSLINKTNEDSPRMRDLMVKLLDKRNQNMANSIADYLKSNKSYFIVIGAGHLVGEKSIIRFLENNKLLKIERL